MKISKISNDNVVTNLQIFSIYSKQGSKKNSSYFPLKLNTNYYNYSYNIGLLIVYRLQTVLFFVYTEMM